MATRRAHPSGVPIIDATPGSPDAVPYRDWWHWPGPSSMAAMITVPATGEVQGHEEQHHTDGPK
jgi:hypothetical protein